MKKRRLGSLHPLKHTIGKFTNGLMSTQNPPSNTLTQRIPFVMGLQQLDRQGMATDYAAYAALVRWCGDEKALSDGRQLHAHISATGKDRNTFLANLLVQMYGKCGSVADAWKVFDKIDQRNMFSWNIMIGVYAQNGKEAEALQLFRHMQMKGVKPNKFTFFPILAASASLRALAQGKQIHNSIVACGCQTDGFVTTALVNMYGKCGSLKDARMVFDEIDERNVMSWNAMIGAYAQNGHGKEALELFRQMELEGIKPDWITFLSILDACANLASLEDGRAIHERIVISGFDSDVAVKTALVNMYGKCGSLKDAGAVFDEMQERDVISWTAMITAYAQNGHGKEALELFRQMDLEGIKADKITFLSTLDACASLASLENGRMVHERIRASGLISDVAVRSALVNMYGKCDSLKDAQAVFDQMHERNVILWSAMIAAYAQNGQGKEALELFRQMDLEGIKPNGITFLSTLDACASLASLENGRMIHDCILVSGIDFDIAVRNALVNMYGKCGSLKDARAVFDEMHERNVISWTTMIAAYAQNGHGKEALELFRQMELEGAKPNGVTFISILNACSHAGLLDAGWQYFVSMSADYAITPSGNHFICMCDLLGRAGYLDEAEDLIVNMPVQPSAVAWTSLLGACRSHGDVERATRAAEQVFSLDPEDASNYLLLSNIYAAAGRWDDASKVRKAAEERGLKEPWCCWTGVESNMQGSFIGNIRHTQPGETYPDEIFC